MSNNTIFHLRNIHYSYPFSEYAKTKQVLSNVDFSLSTGDSIGLIGHNGSGKTTLFHIIMGLLAPDQGSIEHEGKQLRKEEDFRVLRKKVGYLFQLSDDQLFSPTVIEDICFGPLNLGYSPEEALATARETLKLLNMESFESRATHRLSGGEKKMIALATILAMKPAVVLLDEPTNDLDPDTREHLISILNTLDITRCIISHDWEFLHRTCTSFIQLEHGHLHHMKHAPHVHMHTHAGGELDHHHDV